MSLVAVGSAKGSPGATTLVTALGLLWPGSGRVLLAELDPGGGDLAIRLGLSAEPGLVTLAAEGRRELTPELVWGHSRPVPGSEVAHVLAGPASADQATAALAAVGGKLAEVLAGLADVDVLADCGRLDPGSPALAVAQGADLVVVVTRPSVAEIRHLSARVAALRLRPPVALVLVGDHPYGLAEVAGAVGVEGLGAVAHDERGAAAVSAGAPHRSRLARTSALVRTTRSLAETLVARLGPPAKETPAAPEMAPAPADRDAPSATETVVAGEPTEAPAADIVRPPAAVTPPSDAPPRLVGPEAAAGEASEPAPAGGRRPLAGRARRARPLRSQSRSAGSNGSAGHDADAGAHDRRGDR